MYPGTYADQDPDRLALTMAYSGERVTYGDLDERSTRLARVFRDAGLSRGDHVALFAENNAKYHDVVWACLRSGLYLTAVNRYLTAPEVAYIINDCGATALVTSAAMADVAGQLRDEHDIPNVRLRLMHDGVAEGFDSYEDALASTTALRLDDESMGTTMLYSSGTTGQPKGVLRPLPTIKPWETDPRLELFRSPDGYNFREEMTYLSPAPSYHAAPLAYMIVTHRAGGHIVMMEKFDPLDSLRLIEDHAVTHSQWVPTMFVRMLKLPEADRARHDLSSHEVAVHAAAPCPVPVKHQMIDWWGPILHEYYAGSEGNGSTVITSPEWLQKPGSVGRARIGTVHVMDSEGNELPAGEEGAIYFNGGGQFEYHNAPEKTAESYLDGGYSTLGDIGYLDDDGYLFLTDRKANMIISGGVNIYPRECEDILVTHDDVTDVAVFGVPNADLGEEVKAVVQLAPGAAADDDTAQRLLTFCRENLAHYKCPKSIDFIDELPRLPTGKLYKRILKDKYWAEHDSKLV